MAGAPQSFDIVIAGGGLVGLTLALSLDAHGLRVAVVERARFAELLEPGADQRASAVASASARMLEALGVGHITATFGCPMNEIRVTDGHSPLHLHFDGRTGDGPLGYMVENHRLRAELLAAAQARAGIRLFEGSAVAAMERDQAHATVALARPDGTRPDRARPDATRPEGEAGRAGAGERLRAPLLVAADGRRSDLRDAAGIRLANWRYDQASIITTIRHAEPHGNIAFELFFPSGPFAILPLLDDGARPAGGAAPEAAHRSAIVWTVAAADASAVLDLPERAFIAALQERMDGFLGPIALERGPRAYPLGFHHAERYVADRLVLVGDAAHGIHPIAGQGLNLGLRDVAALTEVLVDAVRLGLDLGGSEPLARYQRWRRLDTTMVSAATDLLNRLFGIPGRPAAAVRRLGLAAVHRLGPMKALFMAEARGETGELPKLLRGQLV